MCWFYEHNPHKLFSHLNIGPTVNWLHSEKGSVDIVQLCISDELLERNSQWVNEWFQVKEGHRTKQGSSAKDLSNML